MRFTTPLKSESIKIMLLGSGELGREVAIEAQRLGVETIAVDSYENAPAQQIAHKSVTVNMKDKEALLEAIEKHKPTYILPEVEAINIDALFEAEKRGYTVIPNARAVSLTMNRQGIREFAAKELGLKTSGFEFVRTLQELRQATQKLGFPCVIKPVMSSSGHGQSICRAPQEVDGCYEKAQEARGDASVLIVEEFIKFDYEITMLTARNGSETVFCGPIGHIQQDGDYIVSWQPAQMSETALAKSKEIAKKVTDGLGGRGIFGVELFVAGDEVYFSEVSPRPHDTGMVTMITQSASEFELHLRAVLGLPLSFRFISAGASAAFKSPLESKSPLFEIGSAAFDADSTVRIFGKPNSHEGRRMAVVLSVGDTSQEALEKARDKVAQVKQIG